MFNTTWIWPSSKYYNEILGQMVENDVDNGVAFKLFLAKKNKIQN